MSKDDADLIDTAIRRLGFSTDAQLEAAANLPTNSLSKARTGRQPLSGFARLKILDLLGFDWARTAILQAFGEKGAEWLAWDKKRQQDRAARLADKKASKG
jgi:hypothetical protein